MSRAQADRSIYTIGHSNHPLERFLALLETHRIALVADVRSYPGSRWVPHFAAKRLRVALAAAGIDYLWLGQALGGKRDDPALLTPDGRPDYAKIAALPDFSGGIAQLEALLLEQRVAMLCAEEDPARCHRKHLVGDALARRGVAVLHIRKNGELIADSELAAKPKAEPTDPQLALFGADDD
jgi:uncharacterized protein (DUF488 family)